MLYLAIFPIPTNFNWWFTTAYVMVYLIAPFIEAGFKQLEKKEILVILIIMTGIEIFCIPARTNWGSTFFGLLYIYILARYMRLYGIRLRMSQSIELLIVSMLLLGAVMVGIASSRIKQDYLFWWLQFNNPLIVLEAIGLFFLVLNLKQTHYKVINTILAPNLCIYLFTEGVRPYKYVVNVLQENIIEGIVLIALIVLFSLIAGHIIFYVANKISNFIQRKILVKYSI